MPPAHLPTVWATKLTSMMRSKLNKLNMSWGVRGGAKGTGEAEGREGRRKRVKGREEDGRVGRKMESKEEDGGQGGGMGSMYGKGRKAATRGVPCDL